MILLTISSSTLDDGDSVVIDVKLILTMFSRRYTMSTMSSSTSTLDDGARFRPPLSKLCECLGDVAGLLAAALFGDLFDLLVGRLVVVVTIALVVSLGVLDVSLVVVVLSGLSRRLVRRLLLDDVVVPAEERDALFDPRRCVLSRRRRRVVVGGFAADASLVLHVLVQVELFPEERGDLGGTML